MSRVVLDLQPSSTQHSGSAPAVMRSDTGASLRLRAHTSSVRKLDATDFGVSVHGFNLGRRRKHRIGSNTAAVARASGRPTLPVVPVLTEAAVSIGSVATGDCGNFGWLTAPAGVWLSRLFRARSVVRHRWPCLPEMPADPAA